MRRSLKALYRIYHAQGRMDDAHAVYCLLLRGWVHLTPTGNLARVFRQIGIEPTATNPEAVTFRAPGGWLNQETPGLWWPGKN